MIQDIYPHVFDNSFSPRPPKAGDRILVFGRQTVLVKTEGDSTVLPLFGEDLQFAVTQADYLFSIDDIAYYSYGSIGTVVDNLPQGFDYVALRSLNDRRPETVPFAASTGYHIASWKRYHHYCGVCGTVLEPSATERALVCPSCHHTIYPDIHPAVNILIRNGEKILLCRRNKDPRTPYSLVAGFIEVGEMAEDTVRREPCEEVGLKVKNIHYYGSQPWGLAGNLQIGYYCDVDGSDEIHVDGSEIQDAQWFDRSDIPYDRGTFSITGELIEAFRRGDI